MHNVDTSVALAEQDETDEGDETSLFNALESDVRLYCRMFPVVFTRGEGPRLFDIRGRSWLDFVSGAGALNYGHNHPLLKQALLRYILHDGVVASLDLHTTAKSEFLDTFDRLLLRPRGLRYRTQFCGPTGTNSVEAALRLAIKVTGRRSFVSFSNSYHGMTAGSMAASASFRRRNDTYFTPGNVTFMPFDGFTSQSNETAFVRRMLTGRGSGIGAPAAFIMELVQGEGGVNIATTPWVKAMFDLSHELGALFIVDDIQAGCGRTGKFFSFEHHGIVPDLVCLSKSISGFGFPMSLLLIAPHLDQWSPGEFTGTFRGFTYPFVTAAETIRQFWAQPTFNDELAASTAHLGRLLDEVHERCPEGVVSTRQLGLFAGISLTRDTLASEVQRLCFDHGLLVETCGPDGATLKLLPPINIPADDLADGMAIIGSALERSFRDR